MMIKLKNVMCSRMLSHYIDIDTVIDIYYEHIYTDKDYNFMVVLSRCEYDSKNSFEGYKTEQEAINRVNELVALKNNNPKILDDLITSIYQLQNEGKL